MVLTIVAAVIVAGWVGLYSGPVMRWLDRRSQARHAGRS